MKIRTVIQLVSLLVLMLLIFWGRGLGGDGFQTPVKKTGPQFDDTRSDAPLSSNQARSEQEVQPPSSPAEQEKAVITPTTHSSWIQDGVYEVFGEVENIGKGTGSQIQVKVIAKDPGWGKRLATAKSLIDKSTLAPGQTSSFRVRIAGVDPNQIGSYVLMTEVPISYYVAPEYEETTAGKDLEVQTGSKLDNTSEPGGQSGRLRDEGPVKAAQDSTALFLILTNVGWGAFRYWRWLVS